MRWTLLFVKFIFAFFSFLAFSAYAEDAGSSPDKRDVQSLLKKIQFAAQKLNYSGTFVYQQANQLRASRITHVLDGKNEIEKLEVLDGWPREYIRRNEEITCYAPETRTLLLERRVAQDVFPALLAANPTDIEEYYSLKMGETGRVAGFNCQILALEPKDNLRYGYRLWSEKSTGLLLRAQTLNERGEVIEQIAFTQIAIGNIDHNLVKSSFANTNGWRIDSEVMNQVDLPGWMVRSVPPGFRKIHEMIRMLPDATTSAMQANPQTGTRGNQREVAQIVFSDGLAAISVFIEPGVRNRTEGSLQQGSMNIIGKRQGDFWLTVVGEVPPAAIKQVANSIEFKPK